MQQMLPVTVAPRHKFESLWLGSPAFADVFVGREALQGLQPPSVVVGVNEVGKVCFELIVSIVMVALDGRFLDRAVHALDLAIGPGMLDLGQPMFDAILLAAHIERMCRVSCRRAVRVARRELDPIVGENRVDLVGDSRDQSFEEGRGGGPSRLLTSCTKANLLVRDRWRRRGRACLQRSGAQQCRCGNNRSDKP